MYSSAERRSMMTTGPVAFASAGVVWAEEEALESEDPDQPVSASAPQETSRIEMARARIGRFTDSSFGSHAASSSLVGSGWDAGSA